MFAIVRFAEEDDAPGIIATNWLSKDKSACWFPNVRSESKRNKLLINRETPSKNWLMCGVKVLKEFTSYSAARTLLSQAEALSNLESNTHPMTHKRKRKTTHLLEKVSSSRKKKRTLLSAEESSSEEDEIPKISSKPSPAYTVTPYVQSLQILGQSNQNKTPKETRVDHDSLILISEVQTIPEQKWQHDIVFESMGHSNAKIEYENGCYVKDAETTSSSGNSSPEHFNTKAFNGSISTPQSNHEELPSSVHSLVKKCRRDIDQIQQNQQDMWGVFNEFLQVVKSIEAKLDTLLDQLEDKSPNFNRDQQYVEDYKFISKLPVEMDDFVKLNEKLAESSSFRQRLMKFLMTAGGKDSKALVSNILRKIISDDVGEKFSLTGKFLIKSAQVKQSFEKTEVYKLIIEISCRLFSDAKLSTLRESIGDWLMQSKFRRNRRLASMERKRISTSLLKDEEVQSES